MDISIIILNYQSEHHLPRCIKSLREHLSGVSYEFLVFNNDQNAITSISPADDLRIFNNNKNAGFAKSCNQAAKTAEGDLLFFLNPDTEIIAGNIVELKQALSNPSVGIVAPQLLSSPKKIQLWSAGYKITLLEIILNNIGFIRSNVFWKSIEKPLRPDWVSGAALAIKKILFQSVGGFDENFFMYFEDADLCKRVREKSLAVLVLPSIQIIHLGGQSASCVSQQKKQYYASQDYYFEKHLGTFSLFFLRFLRKISLIFKKA